MKDFQDSDRYDYPCLTPDSVVIDAGGYEGNFARTIADKYHCHIVVFEPVMRFANAIRNRLASHPKVRVLPCALGGSDRMDTFHVQNDSSGVFAGSADTESVHVFSIVDALVSPWLEVLAGEVAVLKLNVEGMEFEILEAILVHGLASRFLNIQVQFHTCAPAAENRYENIATQLAKTHRLTYRAPWVWENWERL